MRKKSINFVAALLVLSLALVGCSSGGNAPSNEGAGSTGNEQANQDGSAESVKWLLNAKDSETSHIGKTIIAFADQVNEKTGGKVEIEPALSGALGFKGPEALKVVRDGMVPISDIMLSEVGGDEPLFGAISMPFVYRNVEEYKLFVDIALPYFEKVAEEKWNQKILFTIPYPFSAFWAQTEINSLEDLKGLKMRTYDEISSKVADAIGATPFAISAGDLYSALSTGVVDSVVTSTTTAEQNKFWEVLNYHSPVAVMTTLDAVFVNLDEFNKLDQETQEIIIQAGKDAEANIWGNIEDLGKEMQQVANENGITTIEPTEEMIEQLEELTEDIRQNWLSTAPPEAQEILDKFYEAVGR